MPSTSNYILQLISACLAHRNPFSVYKGPACRFEDLPFLSSAIKCRIVFNWGSGKGLSI